MYALTRENFEDAAVDTLLDIWSCIDWDKVDTRRAYGIWDEFGSKTKAAAMSTNRYETFVEKLCKKLDIRSLRYNTIDKIAGQSEEFKTGVLKVVREETTLLVLKVRLNKDIRKDMDMKLRANEIRRVKQADSLNEGQVSFTKEGVKVDG